MTMMADQQLHHRQLKVAMICACFGIAVALFFTVYTSYAAHYGYGFGGDVGKTLPGNGRSGSLGHSALGLRYSDAPVSRHSVAAAAIVKTTPTDHDAAAMKKATDPVISYTSTPLTTQSAYPVSSYTAVPTVETSVATYHAPASTTSVHRTAGVIIDASVNNYDTAANVTRDATYEANSGDSSAAVSVTVVAATEVTAYAAAPAVTYRAIYPSTPEPSYAAAPIGAYSAAPVVSEVAVRYASEITTTTVPQAQTAATTASTAPFVACYGVSYAAPCVPCFGVANAGPVCEYDVGTLGYYGGQCGLFFNQ